jgi:uncharacterized protein
MTWRDRFKSWIPTRETLESSRALVWMAPWLSHPRLWHWSRRGVALGVGVGVFFGLLMPLAQIPAAAAAAIVLRANLPVAVVSTLVTNPVTFGPIYYGTYRLGAWMTGEASQLPEPPGTVVGDQKSPPLLERIAALGKPLLVGLATVALVAGTVTYVLINVVWRWSVLLKRRTSALKQQATREKQQS